MSPRSLSVNVHSSIMAPNVHRLINKMWDPFKMRCFSGRRECSPAGCRGQDAPGTQGALCKKPGTEGHMVCDSTDRTCQNRRP